MATRDILEALQSGSLSPKQALAALTDSAEPAPSPPEVETRAADPDRPDGIAVIGMAGRYAAAQNLQHLWRILSEGEDGVREVPPERWGMPAHDARDSRPAPRLGYLDDIEVFDPYFFQIPPVEAKAMDPAHRLFLAEAYHAFEDAGYSRSALRGSRCGVYLGISGNEYQVMARLNGTEAASVTGTSNAVAAGRLSYFLDLRGAALTIDTACSSSLVGIHQACQALGNGEIDLALAAGAATYLSEDSYQPMVAAGMLSPDGACKAFSDDADGFVPGEGVGAVVLKRLADAERDGDDIRGVILATAVNQDGHSNGITAPNLAAQQDLVAQMYARFGIDPNTISYAELHGTGTRLGDPIELEALSAAWRSLGRSGRHCAIGSIKSNLGHLSAAAGVAGLQKVLLCLQNRTLVPTLHVDRTNSQFDFEQSPFQINTETVDWVPPEDRPRRASVSSFGFSGTNAHIVVEEYRPPERPAFTNTPQLVVLSAATDSQLQVLIEELAAHLERHPQIPVDDVAFTMQTGRDHGSERFAVVASTNAELLEALRDQGPETFRGSVHPRRDETRQQTAGKPLETRTGESSKLKDLAAKWVSGEEIDWQSMVRTRVPHRIALPVYPFEKVRLWFEDAEKREPAALSGSTVHHRLIDPEQTLLAQHTIDGVPTVAATAYLEFVAQAAGGRTGEQQSPLQFTDLQWTRLCSCQTPMELCITLDQSASGMRSFSVISDDGPAHCHGKLMDAVPSPPGKVDISAVKARCPNQTDLESPPAGNPKTVGYGPAFRALTSVWSNDNEAFASYSASGEATGEYLDPAILDSAWQAVGMLLKSTSMADSATPMVPFAADRIILHSSTPRTGHVHVKRLSGQAFDVLLADDDGRIVVECRGLALVPARESAKDELWFSPQWEVSEPRQDCDEELDEPLWVLELPRTEVPAPSCGVDDLPAVGRSAGTVVLLPAGDGADPASAALQRIRFVHQAVQALLSQPSNATSSLLYLQDHDDDTAVAAVAGYLKALSREQPQIDWKSITVDHDTDLSPAQVVAIERQTPAQQRQVRYRAGQRQVRLLREIQLDRVKDPMVHSAGVYLVTGALGGVGGAIARRIAAEGARMILTGRQALTAEVRLQLSDLLANGATYVQADLADAEDVESLVQTVRSSSGRLHGVFHTAGVLRDGLAPLLSETDFGEVWAAKAMGMVNLDRALAGERLDFFACFSSASAEIGTVGQTAYCSANAFVDAFAEVRHKECQAGLRSGRFVSIGWPYWAEGGMRLSDAQVDEMRRDWGVEPLTHEQGFQLLQKAIEQDRPHVLPLRGDAEVIPSVLQATTTGMRSEDLVEPPPMPQPDASAVQDVARTLLCTVIAEQTHSDPDRVERASDFGELGIDSIIMMQLTQRLERTFGVLPKTLFFEHADVDELADYFATRHGQTLTALIGEDQEHEQSQPEAEPVDTRYSAPPRHSSNTEEPIAIIGISGRYPGSADLKEFWQNLRSGTDCITEVPADRWPDSDRLDSDLRSGRSYARWGGFLDQIEDFDPLFFGITPREAARLDPQVRLFLEESWHAMEDAGHTRQELSAGTVGVFAASMFTNFELLHPNEGPDAAPLSSSLAAIANRVSYFLDLHGPSLTVDSMCSSSLTAVHLACESIRLGECSAAFAGGVNLTLHPNKLRLLSEGRFAAQDGRCRSFGDGGSGYVPSEGVGVVLLKPLQAAIDDGDQVRAVIRSSATNSGGRTTGFTVPNPKSQAALIRTVLDRAQVDARSVDHVEAHGTGTELGDPIEVASLTTAFQQDTTDTQYCALSSVKSTIGHCEAAAGVAALTKVVLEMENSELAPSLHADELNLHIDFEQSPFQLQRSLAPWSPPQGDTGAPAAPRRALINAFGAGGSNTSILVEEHISEENGKQPHDGENHLLVFSAHDDESLQAVVRQYVDLFEAVETTPAQSVVAANSDEISSRLAEILGIDRQDLETDVELSSFELSADDLRRFTNWLDERFGVHGRDLPPSGSISELSEQAARASSRPDLRAIAQTLQLGREALPARLAIIAEGIADLHEALVAFDSGSSHPRVISGTAHPRGSRSSREWVQTATLLAGDLRSVAADWVRGVEVDWSLLHSDHDIQRISLPLYPFNRQRCWSVVVDSPTASAGPGQLHPLLHQNVSNFDRIAFVTGFTGRETWFTDHKVAGAAILPATAQLEIVRAAAEHATGSSDLVIDDVVWVGPVRSPENLSLSVECSAGIDDSVDVEIRSTAADAEAVLHCSARVHRRPATAEPSATLTELRTTCAQWVCGRDEFYELFAPMQIDYGPSHRVVEDVWKGDGEILVKLSTSPDSLLSTCGLHPALLDGALQSVIAVPTDHDEPEVRLPFAIGSVEQYRPCTSVMWAHVQPKTSRGSSRTIDITLFDDQDQPAVRLREVSFRDAAALTRSPNDAVPASAPPSLGADAMLLTPTWSTKQLPSQPPVEVDRWLVVLVGDHQVDQAAVPPGADVVRIGGPSASASDFIDCAAELLVALQVELENTAAHRLVQVVVRGDETAAEAALLGALQSLRIEDPATMVQLLCVAPTASFAQIRDWIALERKAPEDDFVILDHNLRRTRSWSQVTPEAPLRPLWHDDGSWLITGGAGALGATAARDIARGRQGSRILLLGRSQEPAGITELLDDLHRHGATASYSQCDITSLDDLRRVLDGFVDRHGPLTGVVHCAGITRDRLLLVKNAEDFRQVLSPKTRGLENLDEATAGHPLREMILFSSLAGAIGNVGQVDYATANAFMDRFAHRRNQAVARGTRHGRTVSVGWPLWSEGGMQLPAEAQAGLAEIGMHPIDERAGLRLLSAVMETGCDHIVPLAGEQQLLNPWFDSHTRNHLPDQQQSVASDNDDADLVSQVRSGVAELISAATDIPASKIHPDSALDSYGIDSVLIVTLSQKLEERLAEPVSKSIFFDSGSTAVLARNLVNAHPKGCERWIHGSDQASSKVTSVTRPSTEQTSRPREEDRPMSDSETDIAIIGLAGRYPGSPDLDIYWENLRAGRDCISEIPQQRWDHTLYRDPSLKSGGTDARWGGFLDDHDSFDSLLFGISPSEAELMDPQERVFLETAYHAVQDSGYTPSGLSSPGDDGPANRVGVFVGTMYLEYQLYGAQAQSRGDLYTTNGSAASIANRVSYTMGFHGPSLTLDTMCSSSLVAIHLACQSLRSDDADVALAGGVNLSLHPNKFLTLGVNRFASPTGRCHAFGVDADGYVPSEGVGVVVLKPLARALSDGDQIHGVIKSSAVNQDGRTNGFTAPNSISQTAVVRRALHRAGIGPEQVSYLEAHGTGTRLGDPIEITALNKVFGGSGADIRLGSVKSNIGHCESAAGVAGITKVLLQLRHNEIAPSIHCEQLTPEIDFEATPFTVNRALTPWHPSDGTGASGASGRIAGVSAFGAGGTNAHVILADPPTRTPEPIPAREELIVISARTAESLDRYVTRLQEWTRRHRLGATELAAMANTLKIGREEFEERAAVVVRSGDELLQRLQSWPEGWERGSLADADPTPTESEVRAVDRNAPWQRLGEMWVRGAEVNWRDWRDQPGRRISLPGYAFDIRHHWRPEPELLVPGQPSAQDTAESAASVVGRNCSTLFEQRFETTINAVDPSPGRDLSATGMHGVGRWLAMALSAAEQSLERNITSVSNVVWHDHPIGDHPVRVSTAIVPGDDWVQVEVRVEGERVPALSLQIPLVAEDDSAPDPLTGSVLSRAPVPLFADLSDDFRDAALFSAVIRTFSGGSGDGGHAEPPTGRIESIRFSGPTASAVTMSTIDNECAAEAGYGIEISDDRGFSVMTLRGIDSEQSGAQP